jgi:predicted ATPase
VLQSKQLPASLLEEILAKAGGNPFFLEELARAVAEGSADGATLTVPDTVQTVLSARIGRLPAFDKRLLQIASVIGRDVPVSILQAVAGAPMTAIEHNLAHLQGSEFLHEIQRDRERVYTFKHALTQDVAYESLLHRSRQQYHQQVARVLEAQFPDTAETQPELLAHHYTKAGLTEQAIDYWHKAGQQASRRSAHAEAVEHLNTGLALLKTLPDIPEHTQRELLMLTTLGPSLSASKGHAVVETERVYARARDLCQQTGNTQLLFPVLFGLWRFYNARMEYQISRELGDQCLSQAQLAQDPEQLLGAYWMLGTTLCQTGELALASTHLEQAIALYNPHEHRTLAARYGNDPGMACLSYWARSLWQLGYPDQARQRVYEALRLAQEGSQPISVASAMHYVALIHNFCRQSNMAQEQAEAQIALCTEQGSLQWLAIGMLDHGLALAEQGQLEKGISQVREGLAAYRSMGAQVILMSALPPLAEAYRKAGQIEEGLKALAEALALMDRTGGQEFKPEVHRIKGELLLKQKVPDVSQAECCFHDALDVARRQQAKSLELRAAISLGRLWQQQDKRKEAYDLLVPLYSWFTEGFDTADLQEAELLLAALG